ISLYYAIRREFIIESAQLRGFLSANIKARRAALDISQEKLAELADVSAKMINCIEGCRTWVSDKTLIKLARVLRVEVFQLLVPTAGEGTNNKGIPAAELLNNLRQNIKDDIDVQFDRFIRPISQNARG
ncbi:MAG: helix-turn-helix domain-containing protein, partial [Treponema sp.]|nr:helix-turn-helix domain-containing protein [Treponema sp.]